MEENRNAQPIDRANADKLIRASRQSFGKILVEGREFKPDELERVMLEPDGNGGLTLGIKCLDVGRGEHAVRMSIYATVTNVWAQVPYEGEAGYGEVIEDFYQDVN
jgi:hypothetical protein